MFQPEVFAPKVGEYVEAFFEGTWWCCTVVEVPTGQQFSYVVKRMGDDTYRQVLYLNLRRPKDSGVGGVFQVDWSKYNTAAAPPTYDVQTTVMTLKGPPMPLTMTDPTEDHARAFLASLSGTHGLDVETPGRFTRAMRELLSGYAHDQAGLRAMLRAFAKEGGDGGLVLVRDVPFASLCEHHALPFTGTVAVAYVPDKKIVGLSKVPRLVRAVTRRLQVQERVGQMVGDALWDALAPLGVMVVVRGKHTCMSTRGAESPGEMVTSYVLGVFKEKPEARAEALELMR